MRKGSTVIESAPKATSRVEPQVGKKQEASIKDEDMTSPGGKAIGNVKTGHLCSQLNELVNLETQKVWYGKETHTVFHGILCNS